MSSSEAERKFREVEDSVEEGFKQVSSVLHRDHTVVALLEVPGRVRQRYIWTLRKGDQPFLTDALEDLVGRFQMIWEEYGATLVIGKEERIRLDLGAEVSFTHKPSGWQFSVRHTRLEDQTRTHHD